MIKTATNPKTGERYQFVAGAWVPLPAEKPADGGVAPAGTPPTDKPAEQSDGIVGTAKRYVIDPLQRGVGAVLEGAAAAGAAQGVVSPETAAANIVRGAKLAERAPRNPEDEAALAEISGAKTYGEAISAALRHPSTWFLTMLESLPQSSLSIIGAMVGSLGGPKGLAAGVGLGSAASEYGASLIDAMQALHVDITDPEMVQKAIESPRFMKWATERAKDRAANVGAFDAASGAVAGRLVAGAKSVSGAVARGAGELAIQGAAGAAGEAAAQRAVGDDNKGDVVLEAAAETPGGLVEIITGARHYDKTPPGPSLSSTLRGTSGTATPSSPSGSTAGGGGAGPAGSTPGPAPTAPSPSPGPVPAGTTAAPQATVNAPPIADPPATPPSATPAPVTPVVQDPRKTAAPNPKPVPAPAVTTPPVVAPTQPLDVSSKATPNQQAAVKAVEKMLQPRDGWEPVYEDPDDPHSPVVAYYNEALRETRTPAEHMAPIATPLSGLEPIIAAPEKVAADMAAAAAKAPAPEPAPSAPTTATATPTPEPAPAPAPEVKPASPAPTDFNALLEAARQEKAGLTVEGATTTWQPGPSWVQRKTGLGFTEASELADRLKVHPDLADKPAAVPEVPKAEAPKPAVPTMAPASVIALGKSSSLFSASPAAVMTGWACLTSLRKTASCPFAICRRVTSISWSSPLVPIWTSPVRPARWKARCSTSAARCRFSATICWLPAVPSGKPTWPTTQMPAAG